MLRSLRERDSGRPVVEEETALDVMALARAGLLAGGSRIWRWRHWGGLLEMRGHITGGRDAIVLRSAAASHDEWAWPGQRVAIAWEPCRLGGERPWFLCGGKAAGERCGRRTARLYRAGRSFACRRCLGLRYASQRDGHPASLRRRANALWARLGGAPGTVWPIPSRPKRMRRHTYRRLLRAACQAEIEALAAAEAHLVTVFPCIPETTHHMDL